jgi:DNA polymerase-3 subunit delta'
VSVWDELVGQDHATDLFKAAARDPRLLAHSWLITGPPGSGRSNLAYAFAASLLCKDDGCGTCPDCRQVAARTHPDLSALATERVIISIDEVRSLVQTAQFGPSVSRYRVVVIEDADRMVERTSNVLLKALEEPPEGTIWILCAPSEADLLPTIRSRVRSVRLIVPSIESVSNLIVARTGVDAVVAERAARHAQSHVGMATRLATNELAAQRRDETVRLALSTHNVRDAVMAAARLLEIATEDAKAITEERDAVELEQTRYTLGLATGEAVPANMRSQFRALEEQQKRRETRSLRDGLDRILVDLHSVYRDVLRLQLGATDDLINLEYQSDLLAASTALSPEDVLEVSDAIATTRERISRNVSPVLALESLLVTAIPRKVVA